MFSSLAQTLIFDFLTKFVQENLWRRDIIRLYFEQST